MRHALIGGGVQWRSAGLHLERRILEIWGRLDRPASGGNGAATISRQLIMQIAAIAITRRDGTAAALRAFHSEAWGLIGCL